MKLNNISKEYDTDFNLIKPPLGQFDNTAANNSYYLGIIEFLIGIKPSDFNLDKDCDYLKKEILINVKEG